MASLIRTFGRLSPIATTGPLAARRIACGLVYWLDSANGNDSNVGTSRESPKKTWAGIVAAIGVDGGANGPYVVVLMDGYSETFGATTSIAPAAGMTVISEGVGARAAKMAVSGNFEIDINAAACRYEGIAFTNTVAVTAAGVEMVSCTHTARAGALTIACGIGSGADHFRAEGCTYKADPAGSGVGFYAGAATTGALLDGCTFDGGVTGWRLFETEGQPLAADFTQAMPAGLRMPNTKLLNGSLIGMGGNVPSLITFAADSDVGPGSGIV